LVHRCWGVNQILVHGALVIRKGNRRVSSRHLCDAEMASSLMMKLSEKVPMYLELTVEVVAGGLEALGEVQSHEPIIRKLKRRES
jgi:hypothetical protein